MRKTLLLLVLALHLALPGKAQPVSSYEFTSSQGTYEPLGSETVLWEGTFDNHTETITIPSFNISGASYTSMTVSSNGFITFGGDKPLTTYYSPISGTTAYSAAVSPMGIRLHNAESGDPKISYNTNADGEIVVQWQDVKRQAVTGDVISFQIRLNPSTGTVRFIYGNVSTSYTGTASALQVGLRGSSRDDFNNRYTVTDWSATEAGGSRWTTCRFNNSVYPSIGLTFTWTQPPACEVPVAQPAGLVLNPVSTVRIDGSFTAAEGSDSYLVVRSTEANLSESPADGTTYDAGHTLGNGTVVYSDTGTSFSSSGLTQGTEYHFFVFSMNYLCTGGPLYLTTEPLSGSKHTVPSSPSSFTATAAGTSEISLEATTSHDVVVAWNTVNTFGNPSGSYSAGDQMSGGGTIYYTGPPQDIPAHTGLISGQRYYYRCWTVAGEVYSSTATSNDITSAAIPFFDGFEEGNTNNSEVNNWFHTSSGFFTFTAQNNSTTNNRAPRTGSWSAATNRNCWIFKPVQLTGGQVYRLMMYARQNTEIPEDAAITVSYGTEATVAGMTETLLPATQLLDGGYQLIESYFSPADEGRFYLGINSIVPAMGTMVFITIDDISLEEGPAFPPPTMLSAGNITSSSAEVTWNQHGAAAQWNLKYGTPDFDPATEGSMIAGIDGSSFTLGSLNVMTEYEVRMQAVEGSETSDWSEPLIFSTKVDPLSGNYTIDASQPTSGNNFNSFGDMARYLMDGGVDGPVVVDVANNSGPYSEQVIIRAIEGTSADNTVTINGNGNTLEYLSDNSDERATLKLDGASYLSFDNLEIKALGGGTGQYGWAVHLLNNADNNQFTNCSITAPWASNNTNFAGIVAANSSTIPWTDGEAAANLVISNCTVTGGYFGIIINGPTDVNVHMNLTITDTDVRDFYSTGISLSHQRGATIEGNRIYREDSSPLISPTYMLYINNNVTGTRVVNNRLYNPAGNATSNQARNVFGIYGALIAADEENKLLIANNMIYGFRYMNQTQGGIYISGRNTRIYHNTIALDYAERSASAILYGINHTGTNANMEILNNIIYINSGGTGDKWCLNYATTTGIATSNNNVLFMDKTAGTRNYTGRFGNTNYASLDEWQAVELDLNSLRYDPLFVEDSSEPLVPRHYKIKGAGANLLSAVPADIEGNERTATPDPGARQYEAACISPEDLLGRNNYNAGGKEAWTSWSPINNEDLWSVEYGLQGFTPSSGTTVETGNMPFVIAGLEPEISYDFYVRAHCGDLLSNWSDPETFTLSPNLTVPFFEDFDELEDGDLPPGWSSIPDGSELVKVQTDNNFSYSPPNSMRLYGASVEVFLISPELEEELTSLWMSFQARHQYRFTTLEIGSINSPGEPETFTLISSVELTEEYENYDVYMHMYEGTHRYIAFRANNVVLYIDNLFIGQASDCIRPTSPRAEETSANGALLAWTPGYNETEWELLYGEYDFDPETEGTLIGDVSQPELTLTGLRFAQYYKFHVRAVCSDNEVSPWSAPAYFETGCGALDIPFAESFMHPSGPLCWEERRPFGINPVWNLTAITGHAEGSPPYEAYGAKRIAEGTTRLIMPLLNTEGMKEVTLSFSSKKQAYLHGSYHADFLIQSSSDKLYWTDEDWRLDARSGPDEVMEVSIPVIHNLGEATYIAFVISGNHFAYDYWTIDDITVETVSVYTPREGVASNITGTGARIDWTEAGTATVWNIEYGPAGFTPGTGTLVEGITQKPWDLTGLEQGTTYQFLVQADAGNGELSMWSAATYFSTKCVEPTSLPWSENFSGRWFPACWTQHSEENGVSGDFDSWVMGSWLDRNYVSLYWSNFNGISRLVLPRFDTRGVSKIDLTLQLAASFDDVNLPLQYRMQYSTDGTDWVDIPGWSYDQTMDLTYGWDSDPIHLEIENITSSSLLVAFVAEGDHYNIFDMEIYSIEASGDNGMLFLDLRTDPPGAGTVTGGGNYEEGDQINISATANTGYEFIRWINDVEETVSSQPSFTFTMPDEDVTLWAMFEGISYTITLDIHPEDAGQVTGAGTNYKIDDEVILTATANEGWQFLNWRKDGNAVSHESNFAFTMPPNDLQFTAWFIEEGTEVYSLTLEADPPGGGTVTGAGNYIEGDEISVTTTVNEGYTFVSWTSQSGTVVSNQRSFIYTMPGEEVTLTANFEIEEEPDPEYFTVTLAIDPQGAGTVTGAGDYQEGETVELTATANEGWQFMNWQLEGIAVSTDEVYSFTMPGADLEITAHFTEEEAELYLLTLEVNPPGAGTAVGAGDYEEGAEVNIIAVPEVEYTFVNWTDEGGVEISDQINYTFTMPGDDLALTANFGISPLVKFIVKDSAGDPVAGAEITINIAPIEVIALTTGADGTAETRLPVTAYSYSVTAGGYVDTDGTFTVTGEDIEITLNLLLVGLDGLPVPAAGLNVYPNPGNGMFHIVYKANAPASLTLEVLSVTGNLVYIKEFHGIDAVNEVIDLQHLGKGVYFMRIIYNGNISSVKLIII